MKPRSVYNKVHEFHEFVVNEDVDIVLFPVKLGVEAFWAVLTPKIVA